MAKNTVAGDVVIDRHYAVGSADVVNVLRDFDTLDCAVLVRSVVKAIRGEGHTSGIVVRLQYGYPVHVIKGIWPAANRPLA